MSIIETSSLTAQVYDIIRKKIISREYNPGNKLDIQTLAEAFGVSRSPVKDAINQLVHEGLIEVIPRKGTYVTELKYTEFLEVLDARLMIEKWSVEQIIDHVTEEQIEYLSEIVGKMDAVLEATSFSFEEYSSLDTKFHKTLIEWAENDRVKEIYISLNTHVALSRIVYSTSLESTINRHKDHWGLVNAMNKRDLPAFLNALTLHIESLKKEAELRWDEAMKA